MAELATGTRGYPLIYHVDDGQNNYFEIQRVWVKLNAYGDTYIFDPAFKISEPVSGIPLTNALGSTTISNDLMSAALTSGGTDTGTYAQNLNEAAVRSKLTAYTTNLLNYLQSNAPNASVQAILGGWQIVPASYDDDYSSSPYFYVDTFGGTMPVLSWTYEPTNLMSTFSISFAGTNFQCFMPQLQGQRLSLTYDGNGNGQLWEDDNQMAQGSIPFVTNIFVNHLETRFSYGIQNVSGVGDIVFTNCTGTPDQVSGNEVKFENISATVQVSQPILSNTTITIDGKNFTATATISGTNGFYQTTLTRNDPNNDAYFFGSGFNGYPANVGDVVQSNYFAGYLTNSVRIVVTHPVGTWNTTNNTFNPNPTNVFNMAASASYQSTNADYAILYAFEPDWDWLQQRQDKLDQYLSEGLANGSRQVTCETLNVMGLNWMLQTEYADQMLDTQIGILPMFYHRIGRMAQESGQGYYVDVYMQMSGLFPSGGWDATHIQLMNNEFDLGSYFASGLEYGIIEQLQNSGLVGASTVKMLEIANTDSEPVYMASSTNWSSIETNLINYPSAALNNITANYIDNGFDVFLPKNGANAVTTASDSWAGYAYEARLEQNGFATYSAMIIQGDYFGGYSGTQGSTINVPATQQTGNNQPTAYTQSTTQNPNSIDPVDTADGTYQVETTDLSIGQSEPKGLTFSRYYNGTRRYSNPAGMSGGWIHNYYITADNVAAAQACLGGTTPAQAASLLTATAAAIALYNGGVPDPGNWLATDLVVKWGVDQMTKSGVSVNLGNDCLQFVEQPNGVFTPPADCTATLMQSGGNYVLQMRHGNTFNFNSSGLLSTIVDPYNNSLSFTYNTSNQVSQVTDWKSRNLQFAYNGNGQLISVTDSGGRSVSNSYSAAYNPQGDLTSFTDAQGNTNGFVYDTNHDIIASLDGQGRLVVSNAYNTQGKLTEQYIEGDTNQQYQIFWSGFDTTEFDPEGNETDYYYDDQGRLIVEVDPYDFAANTYYDGQNHVIETVSPLNETNLFYYDGSNNLTNATDALGLSNQYIYDGNNNLVKVIDQRGNATTFGYNSEFSVIGQTNGAGDWANYVYNSDGTLQSRTDSGGQADYTYDTVFTQLRSVAYPGLCTNTFFANVYGDVTNQMDARGFATAFQFNGRRQLTNTIAPTNVMVKASYDAEGNQAVATDARGNSVSNLWNASGHLLTRTLPFMSQGTPVVANSYDNRELLTEKIDPLGNPSFYDYDWDGRLLVQTDPLSRSVETDYDDDGRLADTINAAYEATFDFWDAKSELIKFVDGANHSTFHAYDQAGNQVGLTNRNGNAWQFQFDGANRLTNTVSPLHRVTSVAFNHQGLPALITDPLGQKTTNSYDAKGRLTSHSDGLASTIYAYDGNDNRTMVVEKGNTNSWSFDAYNRVTSYTDVNGYFIQYRYDVNGNLTNLIYPGGKNVYYSYDSNNHLTNVTDWSGRTSSLAYDLDGRLISVVRPNGTYRTISYDAAGEVTNILEQMANSLPIALMRYSWDQAARMSSEFIAPLPHTNTPPARTMSYDIDNELASVNGTNVTADADGNLISGPLTNDTFAAYSYDARNRLMNVGGVTNFYDAINNRVGQTYGTNSIIYIVNPNSKLPQVLERIKNGVTTYYVYGPGLLYQITETPTYTNTVTYHYDSRGSTVALTGDNGLVTDRMEYSLYATMTYHAGTNDTPFLYNGQFGVMTDLNGLLYMKARYYSPFLCRFINPDPLGFSGGMNFYAFANGNPASMADPTGTCPSSTSANGNTIVYTGNPIPMPVNISDPFRLAQYVNAYIALGAEVSSLSVADTFENMGPSSSTTGTGTSGPSVQYPYYNISPNANAANLLSVALMAIPGTEEFGVEMSVGDHIVLGLQSQGLEQTATQVGGRTLMSEFRHVHEQWLALAVCDGVADALLPVLAHWLPEDLKQAEFVGLQFRQRPNDAHEWVKFFSREHEHEFPRQSAIHH